MTWDSTSWLILFNYLNFYNTYLNTIFLNWCGKLFILLKSKTLWQILKTAKLKIDFLRNTCWDRIEGPEIYTYEYNQLTFDKGTKIVFSTSGARTIGHLYAKKNYLEPDYILHTHKKTQNSKWIIDVNVKYKKNWKSPLK